MKYLKPCPDFPMYFHQPNGMQMHSFSEMVLGIFHYTSQMYLESYIRDSVQGSMF